MDTSTRFYRLLVIGVVALFTTLLFWHMASAQTPFRSCHPKSVLTPWGTGTDYVYVKTDKAEGRFTWCPQNDEGTLWRISTVQYCIMDACNSPTSWSLSAAIERIHSASSPASAVEAEAAALRRPMTTDLQRYELLRLYHAACLQLRTAPYPLSPPNGFTPPGPQPSECGPAPVPPAVSWTAAGTVIYKFSGGRISAITARRATLGAQCNGSTRTTIGAKVYQALVGGAADEVTECVRAQ